MLFTIYGIIFFANIQTIRISTYIKHHMITSNRSEISNMHTPNLDIYFKTHRPCNMGVYLHNLSIYINIWHISPV